jgi:hypothetical protein
LADALALVGAGQQIRPSLSNQRQALSTLRLRHHGGQCLRDDGFRSGSHTLADASGRTVVFGGGRPLALIAGPCVIESEERVHFLAGQISSIAGPFVFKASFDKANRSSLSSYRGPGIKEGRRILGTLKAAGHFILTDIHEPDQAAQAAEVADIVQVPAFFTGRPIFFWRPGGLVDRQSEEGSLWRLDFRLAVEKVASTGTRNPAHRARRLFRLQQSGGRYAGPGDHARPARSSLTPSQRPVPGGARVPSEVGLNS